MKFAQWIIEVQQEIASDVEPSAYRGYFDAGLSPVEAVMQSRLDDDA